jgi:signal transduction histidine kinase
LEWLAEEIEGTFGIKVTVRDDGRAKPLAAAARSILYRAVRELLINVAKHAQTDRASVDAACQAERVVIKVSDPGVGFDPTAVPPGQRRRLGLISLGERLSHIGGTIQLNSAPGAGTVAVLSAPLEHE